MPTASFILHLKLDEQVYHRATTTINTMNSVNNNNNNHFNSSGTSSLNDSQQLIKFVKDSVSVMRSVMDKVHHKVPYSHRIQLTNRKGRYSSRLNRVSRSKQHHLSPTNNSSLCKLTKVDQVMNYHQEQHLNQNYDHQSTTTANLPPEQLMMQGNSTLVNFNCTFNEQTQMQQSDSQHYNQWIPQIINENTNYNYNKHYNEPVYGTSTGVSLDQLVTNVNEDEDWSIDNLLPSITSDLFVQPEQFAVHPKEHFEYNQSYQYICL